MDRLESLTSALSQVTVYDIKSMYNQAKNMVLNVSEMEAKVHEATNDDPWGASSTLMQEIAQGTFNFQHFNEIMPAIYARFMEKEARQWREIYKALQLLEYLIKNGSERVVDDARSHMGTVKMLRNFHYIDDKGKDQGINVRNRAKEIVELLGDVEKIRLERRKAKANRTKYTGTGNDGMSFSSGTGGRYGGFGSEALGGGGASYSGGGGGSSSYGGGGSGAGGTYDRDYGGYSGGGSGGFRDEGGRKGGFEEYDAGEDEAPVRRSASASHRTPAASASSSSRRAAAHAPAPAPPPPKAKQPEVDLLGGFGDDDDFGQLSAAPAPATALGTNKALPLVGGADDDDFADFQAAPASPVVAGAAPKQQSLMDMLGSSYSAPAPAARPAQSLAFAQPALRAQSPPAYAASASGGSMFGLASPPLSPVAQQPYFGGLQAQSARPAAGAAAAKPAAAPAKAGGFEDLWTMSLGSGAGGGAGGGAKSATPGGGKSIQDLQREKAQATMWGGGAGSGSAGAFGAFGAGSAGGAGFGAGSAAKPSTSAPMGGADDLLL